MMLLPVSLCADAVLTPSVRQGSIPAGEDGAGCFACVLFGPLMAPVSLLLGA